MGYIGLPLAVFLAKAGYHVLGVDVDKLKVSKLKNREPIINEYGFNNYFISAIESGNLVFQIKPEMSDIFIIAVQTPFDFTKKKADLSFVINALESIIPLILKSNLIILESTVPPFTTRNLKKIIEVKTELQVPEDIFLAYCPERAYPSNLIYEFLHNDRIIGGISPKSAEKAKILYKSFIKGRISLTDDVTAEVVKLVENSYRDVNIAYANEIRLICDYLQINPYDVIELANYHPRVQILDPGIGVGGHCIPIDPWFLWETSPSKSRLIELSRRINDEIPNYIVEKILKIIPSSVSNPKVIIIGKTFKPNVADIRESPAIKIINTLSLKRKDIRLIAVDPYVDELEITNIKYIVNSADLLIILVPHKLVLEYIEKEKDNIKKIMRSPNIVYFNEL